MPPLDEESRLIGKQEGKMELVLVQLKNHSKQMDRIERKLTNLRIKMGGISATVSIAMTVIIFLLKGYIFK